MAAPAAGCSQYFRDVMAGQMPIVDGKEACAAQQAASAEAKCITNPVMVGRCRLTQVVTRVDRA